MIYNDKMSPQEFLERLITEIPVGVTETVVKEFESFLNKYPNPTAIITKIMSFIRESVDEIDPDYKKMSDTEFLETVDYPEDIEKIQKDFSDYGFIISPIEAEAVWLIRSDNWMAQWIDIGFNTNTFLECVRWCLVNPF